MVFDAVHATWNLMEQSATTALQAAYEEGLTVIVKEALANGRLTLRNKTPAFAPKLQLLEQEATRLQSTVDALALAAVLAQPWATIVLSGAATVEQVISNVHTLTVKWDTEATAALSSLKEAPERYWTQRSDLAWN
jgi:aryl-alcohol dehydrogenase-like predicted oxidoreductase